MVNVTFNDGIVNIYSVVNVSEHGEKPSERLDFKQKLRFQDRIVGMNRLYLAQQSGVNISRLIRCLRVKFVSPQDVALINGDQHKITAIQHPQDIYPEVMDLTLEKLEFNYDLAGKNQDGAYDP